METGTMQPRMSKKQKTTLIVLAMVAACLILAALTVFWILPRVMRDRFQLKYVELIQKYSEEYNLDPTFVCGVIYTESKFQEHAQSGAGACGLMQVMPATGEEIANALGESFEPENLFDPEVSIRYGCYYLRMQLDAFDQNAAVALAAYNAGPTNARAWVSQYGLDSRGRIAYIPYEETRNYVNRVLQAQENYANLYPDAFAEGTEE
ncbi:MAG: lytic transglycosylase domain-containing protein [Clostridia bacterium]|nr:lytic transglycosylase domain-containing protein [Clostridia bacterium]